MAGGQHRAVPSLPSTCLHPFLSNGSRDEARRLLRGTEWGQSPWCLSFPCGWISLCGLRASVPLPRQHQHPPWEGGWPEGTPGSIHPEASGILAGSRAEGEEGRERGGQEGALAGPDTINVQAGWAGQGREGAPSSTWGPSWPRRPSDHGQPENADGLTEGCPGRPGGYAHSHTRESPGREAGLARPRPRAQPQQSVSRAQAPGSSPHATCHQGLRRRTLSKGKCWGGVPSPVRAAPRGKQPSGQDRADQRPCPPRPLPTTARVSVVCVTGTHRAQLCEAVLPSPTTGRPALPSPHSPQSQGLPQHPPLGSQPPQHPPRWSLHSAATRDPPRPLQPYTQGRVTVATGGWWRPAAGGSPRSPP